MVGNLPKGLPVRLPNWLPGGPTADNTTKPSQTTTTTTTATPNAPVPPPAAATQIPDKSISIEDLARPTLGIAGGGIYFFWELGVLKYLAENYDLSRVQFTGASAGALAGVLCACNIDPDAAVKAAYRLAMENNVFSRSGGLAGIWGNLIRQWLDELLPVDAAQRCQGRVKIVATETPSMRLRYLDKFATKEAVIAACMASVHIPFFLDGNATYEYEGKRFIDGSLYDFFTGGNSSLITCDGRACVVDYYYDDTLDFGKLSFITRASSSYDDVKALMSAGYRWAERMDDAGQFDERLGDVRKTFIRRALELPGREFHRAFFAVA
jgi:hypothetical protein